MEPFSGQTYLGNLILFYMLLSNIILSCKVKFAILRQSNYCPMTTWRSYFLQLPSSKFIDSFIWLCVIRNFDGSQFRIFYGLTFVWPPWGQTCWLSHLHLGLGYERSRSSPPHFPPHAADGPSQWGTLWTLQCHYLWWNVKVYGVTTYGKV